MARLDYSQGQSVPAHAKEPPVATTGAVPDPRYKGVDSPRPSAKASIIKQPNAQSVRGGTGSGRYLPRTAKPAR